MTPHEPEKLNRPGMSESYDLEEILQEFGTAPSPAKPPAAPQPDSEAAPPTVKDAPTKPLPRLKQEEEKPDFKNDTVVFRPIRTAPGPAAVPTDAPMKISTLEDKSTFPFPTVKPPAAPPAAPQPHIELLPTEDTIPSPSGEEAGSPAALFESYRKGSVLQILRSALLIPLCLFAAFLLYHSHTDRLQSPFFDRYGILMGNAALLLSALLSWEVFWQGIRDLFRLRFTLYFLCLPIFIVAVLYELLRLHQGGPSYAPVCVFLLAYMQYALRLERSGMVHTLHTVCNMGTAQGIFDAPQVTEKNDSLRCAPGDMEDYLAMLRQPNGPGKVFGGYALVIFLITPILSYLLAAYSEHSFIFCWLILLLGAVPWAAMLSYAKPYRALSRKLSRLHSALCGWHSALTFGKKHTVLLRDEDLFPKENISSNGMKLYGNLGAGYIISNALALLDAADNPLTELFEDLLAVHSGTRLYASNYRFYDNNGIGGEVNGESVLVGSLSFMKSMGVDMPDGARVRQAVYVSMRGELCGVFAIKYKGNPSTKKGLRDLITNRNFTVVIGARDFLITPELIASKYELPTDTLIFPAYHNRIRLSESDPNRPAMQGALMAEDTFGAFASTVSAGHSLKISAVLSAVLSLIAGICGLLLCLLLILADATELCSPFYVAVYQLIWTLLIGFLSDVTVKF